MPNELPIRVLLVDDSPFALAVLKKILSSSPDLQVVGTAKNGKEAIDIIPSLNPSVICTDLEMPVMDGLELTKAVMARFPRPILVVSALVQEEHQHNIYRLLEAGAVDVHSKPRGKDGQLLQTSDALIAKIKVVAGVVSFRRRHAAVETSGDFRAHVPNEKIRIVAVGASVGGPQALNSVLRELPASFPVPILCVQHMGAGFMRGLVEWLGADAELRIKTAEPGELPLSGTVYFPQEGAHLMVDRQGRLMSSQEPPVNGHRPSVDVLFKSVSTFYGASAAGVLLTGMGEDGAGGLKQIADGHGFTIAQDEQTSVVFGMPRQAIELGAAQHILPLTQIAETLISEIRQRQERS